MKSVHVKYFLFIIQNYKDEKNIKKIVKLLNSQLEYDSFLAHFSSIISHEYLRLTINTYIAYNYIYSKI